MAAVAGVTCTCELYGKCVKDKQHSIGCKIYCATWFHIGWVDLERRIKTRFWIYAGNRYGIFLPASCVYTAQSMI